MRFELKASAQITSAMQELEKEFDVCFDGDRVPAVIKEGCKQFCIEYDGKQLTVCAVKRVQIFYALKKISDEGLPAIGKHVLPDPVFNDLCYMLDCSRNAVAKLDTLFTLIRHLAVLGYDSLGLYMEDTIKIDSEPYFGYLRTPYTREDIKKVDEYCKLFGIELVPYIQTLAHFNSLVRHYALGYLFDVNDILLVGEEKTYEFIEKLISTCAQCFSSRRINIGMDEAYMLGRGKYMDKNGAKGRFDIMSMHLARVNQICEKYSLKPMMWSDMYFTLTFAEQYAKELPEEVLSSVPENVELIYWDYCSTSQAHYEEMIDKHLKFRNRIGFAGGAWKWLGYTPDNRYSFASCGAAAKACINKGIKDFIVTGWGDNGADCSPFATLPALMYCSQANYSHFEIDEAFKNSFYTFSGMTFDDFMTVDLANRVTENDDVEEKNSVNKYALFNDVLLGTLDTTLPEGVSKLYASHTQKLSSAKQKAGKWTYLFETQYNLVRVLTIKAELGIRLRKAYKARDKQALNSLVNEIKSLQSLVQEFYRALGAQWNRENRANGFDVQDIRIGALKQRLEVAAEKVTDYLLGKTDRVEELEEELLDHMGHGKEFEVDPDQCEWRWRRMTSVNVNE